MSLSIEEFRILVLVLSGLYLIGWIIRAIRIYRFRMRLIDEEIEWVSSHLERTTKCIHLRRLEAIPSEEKMLLQFWKSVRKFKEEIKPVESYYK